MWDQLIELLKNIFGPFISAMTNVMGNLSSALGVDVSWKSIISGYNASEYNDKFDALAVLVSATMSVTVSAQVDRMDQSFHAEALREALLHPTSISRQGPPSGNPMSPGSLSPQSHVVIPNAQPSDVSKAICPPGEMAIFVPDQAPPTK